jgi:hypothetical protein
MKSDGSLEGFDGPETNADPEAQAEGGLVLISQLFGLLIAFVGEDSTLRMVREVWPKLSLKELNFAKG